MPCGREWGRAQGREGARERTARSRAACSSRALSATLRESLPRGAHQESRALSHTPRERGHMLPGARRFSWVRIPHGCHVIFDIAYETALPFLWLLTQAPSHSL